MCQAGLASLAYYYFDVRDTGKQDMRGLLTSLLFQLSARSDLCCNILSTLYYEHHNGALLPSNDVLMQCLKEMVTIPKPGPMYIIVDAVDECPNGPRQRLLGLLDELVQLNHPHLHLCVTSRLESDIETILRPLSFHSISLQEKTGKIQDDIFDYVSDVVYSDQRMKKWPAEDQRLVIDTLSQKADGMYVFVIIEASDYTFLILLMQVPLGFLSARGTASLSPKQYPACVGRIPNATRGNVRECTGENRRTELEIRSSPFPMHRSRFPPSSRPGTLRAPGVGFQR